MKAMTQAIQQKKNFNLCCKQTTKSWLLYYIHIEFISEKRE